MCQRHCVNLPRDLSSPLRARVLFLRGGRIVVNDSEQFVTPLGLSDPTINHQYFLILFIFLIHL